MIMLTLAGIFSAIGVKVFLSPVELYDSGISGTSMLLEQITPSFLSLSVFLLVLNIPLFLYGLKRQGKLFTFYSIYSVAVYALTAFLFDNVIPFDFTATSPLAGRDKLLCAIFGGIVCGFGSGLSVRFGGAIDGVEVLAVIFAKKLGLTVGTFMMIYNSVLYIICGFVIKSWILPLYSILTYFIAQKVIDYVIEGFDKEKCAVIITTHPDVITEKLGDEFHSSPTELDARGGHSGEKKTMLYYIVNRFQVGTLKDIVHDTDPDAFIIISDINDVFSKNRGEVA